MSVSENLTSLAKLALHPCRARISASGDAAKGMPLVILGNGPSLNDTMAADGAALRHVPLMAVNFAACTPMFRELKPEFYVLADPHYFRNGDDDNVARLMESLRSVDWKMTLFVPKGTRFKPKNPLLRVEKFPMTGVEGSPWLERVAYGSRRAMPRPRNVMIPAIMIGIWMGFHNIYLVGADHSGIGTIRVNEQNEVVSEIPHFYRDSEEESARVRISYMHQPLHQVIHSYYVAFRAYHQIERFARHVKVAIYNATPGSYIDAFTRKPLPKPYE